MGEKDAVISKQQLSDEFLDNSQACEETLKVEKTAVCSETDVDVIWQVLFCLTEYDTEEDGEQCGGQNASLLDATGDWKVAQQRPIVLHLTLLTFMELAEDGKKLGGTARVHQDFPQSITADSIKGLGQVYGSSMFCSLHFSCICLSTKIMSTVPLLDLNQQWLSGMFSCAINGMSLFSKTRAKILPAMENRVMPQ